MVQLKLLELFAGSRSVGNVANAMGWQTFSVDIEPFEGIDLAVDIEFLDLPDIPFVPDVIWASPPCTSYSIAAISYHRRGTLPVSDFAVKSDRLLQKTLDIIASFPNAKYFVENPVGMMRKMAMMRNLQRVTVSYCTYGDGRMKPTDIWSNHIFSLFNLDGWTPRCRCFNGNTLCHHEPAPRGSRTGTQGLKGAYERSKIPTELVREILESCMPSIDGDDPVETRDRLIEAEHFDLQETEAAA